MGPCTPAAGRSVPAQAKDFVSAVYGNFPLMIALVVIVTFLLSARAFRSLLLPLEAVLLNVLSVGAAYGILVLVWQDGHVALLVPALVSLLEVVSIPDGVVWRAGRGWARVRGRAANACCMRKWPGARGCHDTPTTARPRY